MIKIGDQMSGRSVKCPQCGKRLVVPGQSDTTAEMVFAAQRAKREADKEQQDEPQRKGLSGIFSFKKRSPNKSDNIDTWLNDFWQTAEIIDEPTNNNASLPPRLVTSPPQLNDAVRDTIPETTSLEPIRESFIASCIALIPEQNRLPLMWVSIGLCIGFILGIAVHSEIQRRSQVITNNKTEITIEPTNAIQTRQNQIAINGTLRVKIADEGVQPDAGAVVIFLPFNKPPAIQFSHEGLRPDSNPQLQHEAKQMVDESGGAFELTDTNGQYNVMLEKGEYLLIFISTQKGTENAPLPNETQTNIQRFFKTPENLVGENFYYSKIQRIDGKQGAISISF
jgi:hypothetical protein